jgi:DNA repair exonuclease SbcCD ATPase subunit
MSHAPHAHSVDWLFAQLPGEGSRAAASASGIAGLGSSQGPSALAAPPPVVWPQPPPAIEDASDLQAAYQWLQNEKSRLEQYTRNQFEMIEEQHQAMLTKHFRSEQMLALRSQELNREMQFLANQTEVLQGRSRELGEREVALAEQVERLAHAQEELLSLEQTSANIRQNTKGQQYVLERLRAETTQLKAVDIEARGRFDAFEAELKERQAAWEKNQADITARQAQMEERYQALERAEQAAMRRLTELDEVENQIRGELEQQEGQLTRDRREVEQMRAQLRCQARELNSNRNLANRSLAHFQAPHPAARAAPVE